MVRHTFVPTQSVYVLDTCTLSWSTPNIQGTPPSARAGHEAITFGNYMIVIGGKNGCHEYCFQGTNPKQ